jgi:putative phosphoesterase
LPRIKDAIDRLNSEPIELVLHAGDYSAPFAADQYKALKAHMIGVFGNNDAEQEKLKDRFAKAGHEVKSAFAEVQAGKLKIAVTHGDEIELLQSLTRCGGYDVLVCGHTHQPRVVEEGRTLVINPEEICGHLTGKSTFAILNTSERTARLCSF